MYGIAEDYFGDEIELVHEEEQYLDNLNSFFVEEH
jgi:hypothetical protein